MNQQSVQSPSHNVQYAHSIYILKAHLFFKVISWIFPGH